MARIVAWLVLALVIFAGVAAYRSSPPPPRSDDEFIIEPRQGDQLGTWMNPSGAAGEWVLSGGNILQNHAVFRYAQPSTGARATLELHHRDAVPSPLLTTDKFALRAGSGAAPPELLGALEARLRGGESAYRWIEPEQHPTPTWLRRLRQLQLPIAWLLVAQSPIWLILAFRRAGAHLAALPRRARLGVLAAFIVAGLVRWGLAPLRLVVLYMGYYLTSQELTLQLPRYGAAVSVFHHVLLRAFAPDHLTILRAHAIIGVLMVPLVAALAYAYSRRPGAAVAAALLWGLVPAFIAHDNSEANTVPLLLWMVAGLLLWLDALDRGGALSLVGGAALLALAVVGRPEFPLLVPAAVLALALGRGRPSRLPIGAILPLAVATALLAIPHLVHVGESAALLAARDSLPMGSSDLGSNRVGVLDRSLYPFALVPFAAASVVLRGSRRAAALLLAVATLGIVLTWVDIDSANILRVQVPGALFYALAVAIGMDRSFQLAQRRLGTPRNRALAMGAAALILGLSVIPCLPAAFARTNEDEEETFLREALRALPAGDFQLVRLGYGDVQSSLSGSPVHLYFPDYLFAPRGSGRSVRGIGEWLRDPARPAAYFYVGTRCYTPEQPYSGHEAPPVVPLREACRDLLDHHTSGAVIEKIVASHGDPTRTGFYGTAIGRPVRLGLYRLRAAEAAP